MKTEKIIIIILAIIIIVLGIILAYTSTINKTCNDKFEECVEGWESTNGHFEECVEGWNATMELLIASNEGLETCLDWLS